MYHLRTEFYEFVPKIVTQQLILALIRSGTVREAVLIMLVLVFNKFQVFHLD